MEVQDGVGGHFNVNVNGNVNGDVMSPESSVKPKLQLPMSCDPPGPGNPAKQMVWIVSVVLAGYISAR